MLNTDYNELVASAPYMNRDAYDYIVDGKHTADGYLAIEGAIRSFRRNEHRVFLRERKLSTIEIKRIKRYDLFGGYDPIETKDFYHTMVQKFDLEALELIRKDNFLGQAYYNACKYVSDGFVDTVQLPNAREVFQALSDLLKRCEYNGFKLDDDVRNFVE